MKEHQCDICGRKIKNKIKYNGYVLCKRHYDQIKKYGKFLDSNSRNHTDKNEYKIYGHEAYIYLYNEFYDVIGKTIIDKEDLPKVKYTKWKLSKSGYVISSYKFGGKTKYISSVILGTDEYVQNINHNKLDNRKSNLMIMPRRKENNNNLKGINKKNNRYYSHIRFNNKLINLGSYLYEEEALWARWYAEKILFKNNKKEPYILKDRKMQIKEYVNKKVQRL